MVVELERRVEEKTRQLREAQKRMTRVETMASLEVSVNGGDERTTPSAGTWWCNCVWLCREVSGEPGDRAGRRAHLRLPGSTTVNLACAAARS